MASRGYGFLGWNNRFRGGDQFFLLDRALVDIGAGISWLRSHGVEVVVLLGNSGGGSLMAAYNAQSHDPVLTQPPFGPPLLAQVTSLPTGDLYVSVAAHLGRPYVLTAWMDPSVTDESDPLSSDPDLDMYFQGGGCLCGGVRGALPGGPAATQPAHHQLGEGRDGTPRARRGT